MQMHGKILLLHPNKTLNTSLLKKNPNKPNSYMALICELPAPSAEY